MSGITGYANTATPASAQDPAAMKEGALTRCVEIVTADPALAASLAAIRDETTFIAALAAAMRRRGVEPGDAFAGPARRQLSVRLPRWPASARRGWHPIALEWGAHGAEIAWACAAPSAEAPFYEQQVAQWRVQPFHRWLKVTTPITQAFVAELEAEALPLKGLIFHMSRCGSTLVAQALKAWPGVRVVSEADVLDTAILSARAGHDPQGLLLRAVAAALAQPADGDGCVVFKLDAWHALVVDAIASRLGAPWTFIYRNPVEVLASHRRMPGKHTVPGMLPDAWLPADAHGGRLELEQHAACVLGAIGAAVVPHARRENLVDYDELPQAIAPRIAAHFGLEGQPDGARLAQAEKRHAKHPQETFIADGEAKRAVADRAMYECIGRWMAPHYNALKETRERLRCLRLPFTCDLDALRADLAAVAPQGWHPHFNRQYYAGDWSGIALRAQAHGRSPLYADPSCGEFLDTEELRRCRYVPQFLAQLECEIESVRFLKLAAGAEIREHRDAGLRFEDGVLRLHVPVHTNADVEFVLGGEAVRLAEGECWYLNFDLPHRIVNRGAGDRVHLVIDARVNAWVETLFSRLRAEQG